jgi:endonuclease/exonuclease/phosphatase family metal-dependent hydrolase
MDTSVRRRSIQVTGLLMFFLATTTAAQERSLAAWNLASNSYFGPGPSLSPAQYSKKLRGVVWEQAKAISLFAPAILALVEVESKDSIEDLVGVLKKEYGLEYSWRFINQSPHLHFAVLARNDQQTWLGAEIMVPNSDLGSTKYRKAVALPGRIGKFDFLLIVVHFKSQSKSKPGELTSIEARIEQASAVARYVTAESTGQEKDFLVLGDYNMYPERDPAAFVELSANSRLRFVSTEELCDAKAKNCLRTHISGVRAGNMLDGYAISSVETREYQADSLERVDLPKMLGIWARTYKKEVSDHYPLQATFDVSYDDDLTP